MREAGQASRVRFGEFVLEPETRRLLRGETETRLGPKALELLERLVERRPRALSKAQLRDCLWPRTVVAESSLATLVGELRAALGDDAQHPRFIRTVYGFGYAFCALASDGEGRDPERGPRLLWRGQEFPLSEGENVVGRSGEAAARIRARTVSRRHARIHLRGGVATLQDLGSKNGTFLGDLEVRAPQALADGDEIRLGEIRLTFKASSETTSTAAGGDGSTAR